MSKAVFLFSLALLVSLPSVVGAQVIINEIMYDLEGSDTGREWIEVFNSGSESADLSGWKLFEAQTNHGLTLVQGEAALLAGGYAVVADNADKFLSDWPGFSGTIFDSSFSLNNTGETLILKNKELVVMDEVTYTPEWGANGDGNSLQRAETKWIAAGPTPGQANAGEPTVPPPTGNGGSGGDSEEEAEEVKTSAGRLKVSLADKKRTVAVGSSVLFRATVSGGGNEPRLVWTFGDGGTATGRKIEHIYRFPGDYIVVLNAAAGEEQLIVRGNVKVFQPEIIVAEVQSGSLEDGYIRLENRSAYEVNLGNFRLEAPASPAGGPGVTFYFPPDTIMAPKSKINFPAEITRLAPSSPAAVRIIDSHGRPILSSARPEVVVSPTLARAAALARIQTEALVLAEKVNKLKPLDRISPATTSPATTTVLELPRSAGLFNRGFGFIKNIFSDDD